MTKKMHPLKRYRMDRKISQTEAGRALGVSVATVSRIEAGLQKVTPELAVRIEEWSGGEITRWEFLPREFLGSAAMVQL